ncbi:unnamed protein product [Musa acuminata subsp. malaccensis]|uniref:(wild Malaysian banana) hypothetical protein n=1 Tax=Musa acuminata subsp. malaccensis TaxID=214687 RepID=A0A804HNG2_MUSAM|nr:unnamed protein product [Musa acuminata subsp. malaccensis]
MLVISGSIQLGSKPRAQEDRCGRREDLMLGVDVGKMIPFSVLKGAGRTLKGRDLRRVRNVVLQKTGFLD